MDADNVTPALATILPDLVVPARAVDGAGLPTPFARVIGLSSKRTDTRSTIQNLQALRGVAVLGVVLFHLGIVENKYGGAKAILPGILQCGLAGVDLFFVISGFVMVAVTVNRVQTPGAAARFLYSRAARIYPLYWIYSILVLALYLFRPTWVNNSQGNHVDLLASFLLLPQKQLPLLMVGWTLTHELYFYLGFALILLFCPRRFFVHALAAWGAAVVFLNWGLRTDHAALRLISHPLTVEFLAGCLIGTMYFRGHQCGMRGDMLLLAAGLALVTTALAILYVGRVADLSEFTGWWRVLIFGVPSVAIVYCATQAERGGYVLPGFLIAAGDASYSIYLSHILTLSAVGRLWGIAATDAIWDNVLALPLALLAVLLVGGISYVRIELPLLHWTRKWNPWGATGNRR